MDSTNLCGNTLKIMRALLVVDMDTACGWSDFVIEQNTFRKQTALEVGRLLRVVREKKILRLFSMAPPTTRSKHNDATIRDNNIHLPPKSGPGVYDSFVSTCCPACEGKGPNMLASCVSHHHAPFEPVFVKTESSVFSNGRVASFLCQNGIDHLLLAGCMTFGCLYETARDGVKSGIMITLVEECVYPPFQHFFENEKHGCMALYLDSEPTPETVARAKRRWLEDVHNEIPTSSSRASIVSLAEIVL